MARSSDVLWTVLTTGAGAGFQILQMMVAARYFSATDFGALAIVNITTMIVLGLQDMGLSSFCIHLGEASPRSNSTLFWISAALGVMVGLVVVAFAPLLETFYAIPELKTLLQLAAINFALIGFGGQYQAHLIRVFKARRLAQIELFARCVSFAITLLLITQIRLGTMAIVIGLLSFATLKLALMAMVADRTWHPRLEFDTNLAPNALKYGAYQAGSQVINQLRSQLDQLIIGKALGPESLGLYSLAKELLSYPMRFLQPLISRLTLPSFASVKEDPVRLRRDFKRSARRTLILSAIVHGALGLLATWIVEVMYGARFISIAPLIPTMVLFGALRPLGFVIGMLAQATGQTGKEFAWNIWSTVITLPCLALVARFYPTVEGFAINLSVTQVLITFAMYPFFLKPIDRIGAISYLKTWTEAFAISLVSMLLARTFTLPSLTETYVTLIAAAHQIMASLLRLII